MSDLKLNCWKKTAKKMKRTNDNWLFQFSEQARDNEAWVNSARMAWPITKGMQCCLDFDVSAQTAKKKKKKKKPKSPNTIRASIRRGSLQAKRHIKFVDKEVRHSTLCLPQVSFAIYDVQSCPVCPGTVLNWEEILCKLHINFVKRQTS